MLPHRLHFVIISMPPCCPTPRHRQVIKSRAAGPGMAAGLVWNLGNLACILAVTDKRVGLAIAMPIMQVGG